MDDDKLVDLLEILELHDGTDFKYKTADVVRETIRCTINLFQKLGIFAIDNNLIQTNEKMIQDTSERIRFVAGLFVTFKKIGLLDSDDKGVYWDEENVDRLKNLIDKRKVYEIERDGTLTIIKEDGKEIFNIDHYQWNPEAYKVVKYLVKKLNE